MPEDISKDLIEYVRAIRESEVVVNTAIVIAAGMGMVKRRDPSLLECNGGHVTLKKSWAKYLLSKLNFVKNTIKCKVDVKIFAQLKGEYLINIKAVVMLKEITDELIINWDQTGIKYVPVSEWTMVQYKSKRVETAGVDDKTSITTTFAASLTGSLLPVQLVY